MSDKNLSEEIINSESLTENESTQNQDQSSINDQDSTENTTEEIFELDDSENKLEEEIIEKEDDSINQEEVDDDKEENIEQSESIEQEVKEDEKAMDEDLKKDSNEKEKIESEEKSIEKKESLDNEKNTDKSNDDTKISKDDSNNENMEKMNVDEKDNKKENSSEENKDENKEENKDESKDDNKDESKDSDTKNSDGKKSDKDDVSSNKRNYSNNYRNSDKGYGRFPPRGHQYSHHPYDDWGRRRGMNYPPYYEKDRRHGMRDFRSRDYRDFYDVRMGRDFRGFRDRDRDYDYPKFYGRGRDQRFFNKRDRDFKYKRDYYDDYNRGMDKDMRMNNSMKECRVYVQNLSYEVTTEMLTRFMEKVGKVVSAEILTSPDGRSKGCAIVQYETPGEARRAISDLQDNQFQGRPIHIREDREGMQYNSQMIQDKGNYSDKQGGYQGEGGYPQNTPPKEQRIFVGNLDVNVTANDLRTLFEPAGTINYADVFQKDRNQQSKHGIIGFQDASSIKKAIEMFNGVLYRNRKLDVHEDRRGILPMRRFNSYKSDKNMSIHNAGHHPYPSSKPYPSSRGGKGGNPYPGKFNSRQPPPPHHQNAPQKMQQPPLPPHPSSSNTQEKPGGNNFKNPSHIPYNQQQNSSVTYSNQPTTQHSTQPVQMQYTQSTTQTPYMQQLAATTTYSQPAQSTYAQQGVQQAALYPGYPVADQSATNTNVAYQSSYQTAAYYSSLSHQAQPVAIPTSQPVQQPYPVATNVDYNNLYSAYYGQASQVGASGYPMMTQSTTTATVQGQTGYTAEGSTLPTTYNYY